MRISIIFSLILKFTEKNIGAPRNFRHKFIQSCLAGEIKFKLLFRVDSISLLTHYYHYYYYFFVNKTLSICVDAEAVGSFPRVDL